MSTGTGAQWVDGFIQIGDGTRGTAIGAYGTMPGDWLYVGFAFHSPDDPHEFNEAFGKLIATGRLHAGPMKRKFISRIGGGEWIGVPRRFCVMVEQRSESWALDAEFAFTCIPVNKLPKRHREYWSKVQKEIGDKHAERYVQP